VTSVIATSATAPGRITRNLYGAVTLTAFNCENDRFNANFPGNVTVRENFENRPVFDEVMRRLRWLTFLAHPVYIQLQY